MDAATLEPTALAPMVVAWVLKQAKQVDRPLWDVRLYWYTPQALIRVYLEWDEDDDNGRGMSLDVVNATEEHAHETDLALQDASLPDNAYLTFNVVP